MAGREAPIRATLIQAGGWVSSSTVTFYHLHGKRPIICGTTDHRWYTTAIPAPAAVLVSANWQASPRFLTPAEGIVEAKTDRIPFAA